MDYDLKCNVIQFLRPNAEFTLVGDKLDWLDENQTKPTDKEIESAVPAYLEKIENDKIEMETKKAEILKRLGITHEEARIILS